MQVQTYNLHGQPDTVADLYSDDQAQLWLDGAPVLAVTLTGPTVMLTLPGRLVLLAFADYWKRLAAQVAAGHTSNGRGDDRTSLEHQ